MSETPPRPLPPIGLAEVAELLSKSAEARKSIIVGGQALNIWAVRYGIRPVHVMVSADIDLYGSVDAATAAGLEWGARIRLPEFDHATPNTASLILEFAGGTREIDVLNGILGVRNEDLERLAVQLTLSGVGDVQIKVMHPLHCMISQIENAYDRKLNRRADPKTGDWVAERARISVRVLNRNITEYLQSGDVNTAKRLVEEAAIFAKRNSALKAYFQDGIDVLDAVPANHPGWKAGFRDTVLEPIRNRINKARQSYARRKDMK